MQAKGLMPKHWGTGAWQMFREKYLYQADNPYEQYMRIARTLAAHTPSPREWTTRFFDLMWKGWLSPSTPILANCGTTRGLPVSCAGSYIGDSLYEIFDAKTEVAMLTKFGFGTASYLGDIRPRGSPIFGGGVSNGVVPIIKGFQEDMEYVAQGTARRGSWAGYLPISHGDFYEVAKYLEAHPDGNNIGWNIYQKDIDALINRNPEMLGRYQQTMATKMVTGKGYFFFPDKVNAKRPQWYIDHNLDVKAAQLCNEITLHSGPNYTYTCVLASMNAMFYHEWKNTNAVYEATVFLDAVAQEFIERAKNVEGLQKAVAFTKKSRALGLGLLGLHSLYQTLKMPFASLEAYMLNNEIFRHMRQQAERATADLAKQWGEPEWCKGYGRANSHLLSVAPTKSTALIMGGYSEGIGPVVANVFTQMTTGGEIDRVDPVFLDVIKAKGMYDPEVLFDIREHMGSIQHVDWLDAQEKEIFKTAFEIDQYAILRQASARGKHLDQWQSLNLYFSDREDESYINGVHKAAFLDPNILGLYYVYSQAGVQASSDRKDECMACQ